MDNPNNRGHGDKIFAPLQFARAAGVNSTGE